MATLSASTSTSPTTSTAILSNDLPEAEVFSDDSGVDVKPQVKKIQDRLLKYSQETLIESSRKNKRKSSEPKKRKDVLLMKRFRWDTDDEDNDRLEDEDIDDVFDRERPSSGDSGCQMEPSTSLDLSTSKKSMGFMSESIQTSLDLSTSSSNRKPTLIETKKKQKQWRKPKATTSKSEVEIKKEIIPSSYRQSVIRKHEPCSTSQLDATTTNKDLSLHSCNVPIVPVHPQTSSSTPSEYLEGLDGQESCSSSGGGRSQPGRSVGRPRNYKSMSRQRRIEANARERSRVHTISAAFEDLRRAVPAYAHNQKLSKLAILRIASAYIVALACLNEQDYSQEQSEPNLSECVDQCTRTIQAEGRSRRRSQKD